jgi:hypothetical protein
MTGKEYEREIRSGRARLKLRQSIEKPVPVEVEAAGRLAIAGKHLEAVFCEDVRHAAGVEDRIYIIRSGPDASSDLLRHSLRCAKCGRMGAVLVHPGWGGSAASAPFAAT